MRSAIILLGVMALAPAARAQYFVPYSFSGQQSAFGFGISGRGFAFGSYSYRSYSYIAPYGFAYSPFDSCGNYGYFAPAPLVIVTPAPRRVAPNVPVARPEPAPINPDNFIVLQPNKERAIKPLAEVPAPAPPVRLARFDDELTQKPDAAEQSRIDAAEAAMAFERGEYGRAAELFRKLMKQKPNEALFCFLLAQAELARGRYAEAVAAVRQGIDLSPNWPKAPWNMKAIYGRNALAYAQHYKELAKQADAGPNDPILGFLSGYCEWFDGDKAQAITRFRKASANTADNAFIERFLIEANG